MEITLRWNKLKSKTKKDTTVYKLTALKDCKFLQQNMDGPLFEKAWGKKYDNSTPINPQGTVKQKQMGGVSLQSRVSYNSQSVRALTVSSSQKGRKYLTVVSRLPTNIKARCTSAMK